MESFYSNQNQIKTRHLKWYCSFFRKGLFHTFFILLFVSESWAQTPNAAFSVSGPISGCAPLSAQFVNNSTNAVSYFWDFGNGNTSTLVNPSTVYITSGNYSVKLVATGATGLKDSLILNNYIQVVNSPVTDFTANTTSGCENTNSISFTNLSQNFTFCLWDFGDGNTSTTTNPVHTYNSPGQFNVTLVAYNGSATCSTPMVKNQYITIHPTPAATFTVNQTSTCDLSQVFSFTSNSSSANTWNWNFGDGNTSNLQNPNHTYSASGTFSVSLVVTNSFGCIDTITQNNLISVLNNPLPAIFVSVTSGCHPLTTQFSTSTSGGSSYQWNFGDGFNSGFQNSSHQYVTPGTYPVTLTVNYSNGCSNSATYTSINVLATPAIYYVFSAASGCSPLGVSFTNITPVTGNSFLWNFGDGNTSTQVTPNHTYTQQGSFQTSLTVTNVNGCSGMYSYPVTVNVLNPDAGFSADIISGCPPLTVNFTSYSTTSGNVFNWNFGDGNSSSLQHPSHTYTTTGNFNVTLTITDANGCIGTFIYPSTIAVNSSQTAFVAPAPVTACAPFTVNLSDSSFGAISWLWDFDDGNNSTLQSTCHTFTTPGTYNVSLTTLSNGSSCSQFIPNYSTFIIEGGEANFTYTNELCPPYIAYFNDSSVNAVSWFWDFGDGTTSTLQNPTHLYANPGTYSVSLTITTSTGCTFTVTHNYAVHFDPLTAFPVATTTDTLPPLTVQFTANTQGATQWLWNFGDGGTSTLPNPIYTFNGFPPYNITLTISNDSCTYTMTFPNVSIGAGSTNLSNDSLVCHAPDPQNGCAPLTIHFHNPVLNAVNFSWDFGDGTTSTLANPVHTYSTPGVYNLTLITEDIIGAYDTMYLPQSIQVNGVVGDFSIQNSNSCTGNSISLVNNTTNGTAFLWNFGDSTSSSLANPTHIYSNPGNNYVISLFVTDSAGCSDFLSKSFYGIPSNAVSADKNRLCANDTVHFFSSNLNFASYLWDFGDGIIDSAANPFHIFSDTGSYAVSLTVSDTSGCQQTFTLPYNIQVFNPIAGFTVGAANTTCYGTYFPFTNTSINSTSWLWDFGDGYTSTVQNPYHYYSVPGYYTVTLTAYQNLCSSIFTQTNLIYIPNRKADFAFAKSSDCLPSTITFNDQSTDAATWHWDFGDGTISTLQNPVHVYTAKPASPVLLTIGDIYGCYDTTAKIVINPTIAAMSLAQVSGCNPLQVSFTDSSSNVASWLWDFDDGSTDTVANPVHIYNNNGYYNVQLVVTSASGCTDTVSVDSLVYVAGPIAQFSVNNNSGCAPALFNFTDNSADAQSWFWDFGDSSYSVTQNPSHIYTTPGTYSITLIVSDSTGCSDTLHIPNMIEVRGPVAGFSVSSTQGCEPLTIQFTNTSVNANNYFWNFGDGDTSSVFEPLHNYLSPGSYIVSLITNDSTGCESIFTYPDTIFVYQVPVAQLSVSDSVGCSPMNVSFTNQSVNGLTYSWNFGDGNSSTQYSPTHTYAIAGVYTVTLITTGQGGCADTLNYPNSIYVYNSPVADFVANVTEGCSPLSVIFGNLSSGIQNAAYLWNFGNGITSTQQNPFFTFSNPGFYTVSLTVTNGGVCTDVKTKVAYIHIYDTLPPAAAPILNVTVTSNTSVDITWANIADPNLYAYNLFRLNQQTLNYDFIYSYVDTGSSGLNVTTTYSDKDLNTLDSVYTYKIQTISSCGNKIALSALNPHTTINVSTAAAGNDIAVSWTPYLGCTFNEYEIYRDDDNNGIFHLIASVPSSQLSYLDTAFLCPDDYSYKIRAVNLCGNPYHSFSDTASAMPPSVLENQQVDVVYATVQDDRNVFLEWGAVQIHPETVVQYDIYRSVDKLNYEYITSAAATDNSYLDASTDVHYRNYYYKIKVINLCNITTAAGKIGSSVLLTSEFNEEAQTTKLRWTRYEDWDTGVERYVIERKNYSGTWEVVKVVDGSTLETEDK